MDRPFRRHGLFRPHGSRSGPDHDAQERGLIVDRVDDPRPAAVLTGLRKRPNRWVTATHGAAGEPAAVSGSDLDVYLGRGGGKPESFDVVEKDIARMRAWAAAGR